MRETLVTNFGTLVFLLAREEEVDLLAAVHLGTMKGSRKQTHTTELAEIVIEESRRTTYEQLTCPPGTLGRLSVRQGFVASPACSTSDLPLTCVPWFEDLDRPRVLLQSRGPGSRGTGMRAGPMAFGAAAHPLEQAEAGLDPLAVHAQRRGSRGGFAVAAIGPGIRCGSREAHHRL
jgi:hypothetical protein